MRSRRKVLLVSAAAVALFVVAWLSGRQVGLSTSLTTRVYDVRELLIDVPNYDDVPYMGLDPDARKRGPPPPTTAPSADQRFDELAVLIRSTIDPESWSQPGRALTRIAQHIAVTSTPQTHQKIDAMLGELRAARSTMIQVEARLMSVDAASVEGLAPAVRDRVWANDSAPLSGAEVEAILAELKRVNALTISVPRVSVFSGQRAYVLVANQRAYVAALRHVVKNGVTTFEPDVDVAQAGHMVDLRATASPDRKHVTFTLRTQFSEFVEFQNVEQHKAPPPGGQALIQRPVVNLHALGSTVTVPVGRTVVLWSFDRQETPSTLPGTRPTTGPAAARRFLLFISPTIPQNQAAEGRPTTFPSR